MAANEGGPKGNQVGKQLREAATYRMMAKVDAHTGRIPIGNHAAGVLEESARSPIRAGLECAETTGAGGELILNNLPATDSGALRLRNTVQAPDMVTASASLDRLRMAEAAGCLDVALDVADTIQPKNTMEMMLAHQAASAHQMAMRLAEISNSWMNKAYPDGFLAGNNSGTHAAPFLVEATRAANASARLMGAYQDAMLTLARVRGGGKQTVVVQYVQVKEGGQAIVAGKMGRGPKRRGG